MRPLTSSICAALALSALACGRPAPVARAAPVTTFDHESVFPLKTGEHHKNIDCDSCHGAFDSFTKFDCLGCHGRPAVDPPHAEMAVTGYAYESVACYKCHPNGDCHPTEDRASSPDPCGHADGGMGATAGADGGMAGADGGMGSPDAGAAADAGSALP